MGAEGPIFMASMGLPADPGPRRVALKLFGTPVLESAHGALAGRTVHRHRLALLAVLSSTPRHTVSRDKLLGLLWPEAESGRARHLLNVAVHELRDTLGAEVLVSVADSMRLDTQRLSVDVVEFREAAAAGDLERAAERYVGPFLDGFFLAGSPEFDRWAEAQRASLAAEQGEVLEELGRQALSGRTPHRAAHWYRRLVAMDPYNTGAVIKLMTALERMGDAANAVQLGGQHEAMLRDELGAAVDPAFSALLSRLRAAPQGLHVTPVASPGLSQPVSEPRTATTAHQETPSPTSLPSAGPRRRAFQMAASAAALGIVIFLGSALSGQWPFRGSVAERDVTGGGVSIAVIPFGFRGGDDSLGLAGGLGELLSTGLDVPGELRAVEPGAVVAALRRAPDTTLATARRVVAQSLGVGRLVTGEAVQVSGRLRLSAAVWLVRPGRADSALATVSVSGASGDLFALVDQLTARLLAAHRPESADKLERVAARTTTSLEALKLFLAGSSAYRRGEFVRAATLLERATEIDSSFGLAYYRLATSAEWSLQYERARAAVGRAVAHAARLGPTERLMAEALDAYLSGRLREAEAMLERLVSLRPEDTESWFRLAEIRFHCYAFRDRPMGDSKQAWQNALGADSIHAGVLLHLARLAALDQDSVELDQLVARLAAVGPKGDRLWEARTLQAFVGGRAEAERRLTNELIAAGDSALLISLLSVTAFTDNIAGGRSLALALRRSPNPDMRRVALLELAELEMAGGRPAAADGWLSALDELDADLALLHRAYFATLPLGEAPPPLLDSLARALAEPSATASRQAPQSGAVHAFATVPPVLPELYRYVAGRVAARLGRWPDVEQLAAGLRSLDGNPLAGSLGPDLALALGALRALALGDRAGADSVLRLARIETRVELLNSSWFYSQSAEQFERAALARWRGRTDLALATYAAAQHSRLQAAPAAFAIGEMYEERGNPQAAMREYRRVVHLFAAAEPAGQLLAEQAGRRLSALGAR